MQENRKELTDTKRFAKRIQIGCGFLVELPTGCQTQCSTLCGVDLFKVFVT